MVVRRVLVVEDQRQTRNMLGKALESLEHELEVVEVPSGEEALLDAARHEISLLVADYRLPGMTGIELMKKVRGHHPQVKVMLITGLTEPKVRKEVAEAGADAFFIKPVSMADFLDAVERHLGLVDTLLPAEPIDNTENVEHTKLPDLLVILRKKLGARAAILINERGRILARAGDLPDSDTEASLLPSLMAIFSAGQKISNLLAQKEPSSWHVFNGGNFDIVFTPVGLKHGLFLLGKRLASESKIIEVVSEFSQTRQAVGQILVELSAPPPVSLKHRPAGKEKPAAPEPEPEVVEPIFKDSKKKIKPDEMEAFWSDAAEKQKSVPITPDVITYEQARKLGLTPEDEA